MSLQQFLTDFGDVQLTLTNDQGEAVYIGEADTVKPRKSGNYVRFPATVIPDSAYPWTLAILHRGRKVYTTIKVAPVRVTSGMVVELVVA